MPYLFHQMVEDKDSKKLRRKVLGVEDAQSLVGAAKKFGGKVVQGEGEHHFRVERAGQVYEVDYKATVPDPRDEIA